MNIIYTQNYKMKKLIELIDKVASSRATILLQGESGTGKELFSRYIHAKSARNNNKFYAINTAAVPENLLESELFGFEKGAFTGASQRKIGKFEQANGSTLLLDEISEMPLVLQAKILRVLQENEIERVGGTESIPVNVRLVAATNRNLGELVKEGKFREDLYYRLLGLPIALPPLRDRKNDIMLLADFFLSTFVKWVERVLTPNSVQYLRPSFLKHESKYKLPFLRGVRFAHNRQTSNKTYLPKTWLRDRAYFVAMAYDLIFQ